MSKIQEILFYGLDDYEKYHNLSTVQRKAAHSILACKTGKLGFNVSICEECAYIDIHNNSCRNRNCPNCQAVLNETWVDDRRSEVIDGPYFHVVFTIPAGLNPIVMANHRTLYSALHKCAADTFLELSQDPKYLGATPEIIQVLHTWGQELNFHPPYPLHRLRDRPYIYRGTENLQ